MAVKGNTSDPNGILMHVLNSTIAFNTSGRLGAGILTTLGTTVLVNTILAGGGGEFALERVGCGKDRCKKCAGGGGHGPYWYPYFRRLGKLGSRYIGKELPPELLAIHRVA